MLQEQAPLMNLMKSLVLIMVENKQASLQQFLSCRSVHLNKMQEHHQQAYRLKDWDTLALKF